MESSGRVIQCNCLTWLSLIGCVTQSVCAREKSTPAFLFVSSLWLLVLLHSQFHKINPSMIFPYNKQSNIYGKIETLHHTDVFVFKRQEGISPARTVTPPTAPDVTFRFGHLLHNSGSSGPQTSLRCQYIQMKEKPKRACWWNYSVLHMKKPFYIFHTWTLHAWTLLTSSHTWWTLCFFPFVDTDTMLQRVWVTFPEPGFDLHGTLSLAMFSNKPWDQITLSDTQVNSVRLIIPLLMATGLI